MKTLGLEPKTEIEQLSSDDDRLQPAIPMIGPPGAQEPMSAFPFEMNADAAARMIREAVARELLSRPARPGPSPTRS